MISDLRYTIRSLRRSPASAVAAVLTLALVAGAGAAIFSVVDAALLRPLPHPNAESIVQLGEIALGSSGGTVRAVSYPTIDQWRSRSAHVLAALEPYDATNVTVLLAGTAQRVNACAVTPEFFTLVGVQPAIGRSFTAADRGTAVTVVSHTFWRRALNADPGIIGRQFAISGVPTTVVGILPPSFQFLLCSSDIWLPLAPTAQQRANADVRPVRAIGRLAPGVSIGETATALDTISAHSRPPSRASVVPLRLAALRGADRTLWVLLAAAALAFIVAMINLASLFAVRAMDRQHELAIRAALGAPRGRIVWQLLLEAYAMVALGTGAGLLLAAWLTPIARTLAAQQLDSAIASTVELSWRVVVAIAGVSIVSASFCGLAPQLRTRSVAIDAPRRGVTATRHQRLFRRGLITAQVSIAFVLVVAVTLVGGSLHRMLGVDRGFTADGVVAINVSLPAAKYNTPTRVTTFYRALQERIAGRLGYDVVTVADELPLTGDRGPALITPYSGDVTVDAAVRTVAPGYFALLRTAVLSGREFNSTDDAVAPPRVIVSRSLARALYPRGDASGQRVRLAAGGVAEIVGVVEDVKLASLDRPATPTVYFCAWQVPSRSAHVIARSPGTLSGVLSVVRAEVAAMDPDLPVYGARWLADVISRSPGVPARRVTASAFGAFATLALVLAGIGLFGLFSHDVASRRRELALRVALGATPRVLQRAVFSQVGLMLALGLGAGIVLAVLAAASLRSLLFGAPVTDPSAFLVAGGVIALVALVAAVAPARRAAGSDPIVLLNAE